jgi:hypothetical protein
LAEIASILFQRHPVMSMRTPEGTSAARVKGFTSENVARFFDIYESVLRKVNHPVHRIFNADETRIKIVQHKHSNVISTRGKKEEASLTLAVLSPCMNATGTYVPPLIVFSKVIYKN